MKWVNIEFDQYDLEAKFEIESQLEYIRVDWR